MIRFRVPAVERERGSAAARQAECDAAAGAQQRKGVHGSATGGCRPQLVLRTHDLTG